MNNLKMAYVKHNVSCMYNLFDNFCTVLIKGLRFTVIMT